MRAVGSLMLALSVLALFAGVGCSADGYTPKCTPANDWADCLGPSLLTDSGTDSTSQPDAAVDQGSQQEAAAETGPDTAAPDSETPDTAADSPMND